MLKFRLPGDLVQSLDQVTIEYYQMVVHEWVNLEASLRTVVVRIDLVLAPSQVVRRADLMILPMLRDHR